jgi:hypothetical protein
LWATGKPSEAGERSVMGETAASADIIDTPNKGENENALSYSCPGCCQATEQANYDM